MLVLYPVYSEINMKKEFSNKIQYLSFKFRTALLNLISSQYLGATIELQVFLASIAFGYYVLVRIGKKEIKIQNKDSQNKIPNLVSQFSPIPYPSK